MDKKHKAQKSMAGTTTKNARPGVKNTHEKSHVPQKSNANIDKKSHAQTAKVNHKQTEQVKKTNTTKMEEAEKPVEKQPIQVEKPPVKVEKPPPKVEKPPVKVEKPPPKVEKPPAKVEKTPTVTKTPSSSTASSSNPTVQSVLDSKKANDEKRDLNKKFELLKKENIDLRKKVQDYDTINNELMNEIQESQKSSEHFIKERNDMEIICKKAQQELKLITQRNDELSKKVEELQDDIEIYKEESETKELEKQVLQKEYNDYKAKVELEIKNAKLNQGKNQQTEEKKQEGDNPPQTQPTAEDNAAVEAKINELEDIINDLSNQLNTTTEERDYAITYYKGEIEKLNNQINELTNKASVIPEKDVLIRQLTEKLKEDEGLIEALKNQIALLSPANEMYEELIIEKEELESKLEEIRNENVQLKDAAKDNADMVNELEEMLQLTEQSMKDSKNEALVMKNKCEELELKVKEYEDNQTMLLDKIEDLKNKNKMLKEDHSMLQGSSQNMNNIWIEYLTSKNIIQNLKRQTITLDIYMIDNEKFLLRNKIVKNMIPKKLLETGNIAIFDKFLNINSYRKKAFKLIMNQLNNEILTDDLGVNPNKVEDDKMGKVEGEEKKKVICFYESTINILLDFYSYLLKIEIYLCELSSEQFLKINNENSFNDVYHSIIGGSSIFNTIINLVKTNNFGIQYKPNVDGLKNINTQIKTEIEALENIEENNLYLYLITILNYFINISCGFKKERIDIIVEDLDIDEKLKNVADSFFDSNKNFNNIITQLEEKIFDNLSYSLGNNMLDIENISFQDLTKKNTELETGLSEKKDFVEKYTILIEVFNKVYLVMKEALEKFEPSKIEEPKKTYEDDRVVLPVPEWNNITDVLYSDLDNITKVTEELDKSRNTIEDEKKKYMELQIKYETLEKMKNENDSKLGELLVKLGKFTQLESTNEENSKKIEKYQKAVVGLQNTVNNFEEKEKEYKARIEILEKKEKEKRHMKKTIGVDLEKLKLSNGVGEDGESINGGELLKTVFLLQKERKNYKNKFMKEKLNKLMEDKDSYVNKYIQKDYKLSKKENEKDKTMYQNIQNKVININKGYDKIRKKLCLPKVFDLSKQDYDYEQEKKKQEDEIESTRIQYMNDVDGIFFNMFGEKTNSKTIKEMVNSDVNKNLETFADKKFLVGKIQFNETKIGDNKNMIEMFSSKNTLGVPIIINEDGFKTINQNFIE